MAGETNKVVWRGVRPVSGIRGVWPAIDSVRIFASNAVIKAETKVVYAVPANKIFFLSSANVFTKMKSANDASGNLRVRNALDVLQYAFVNQMYDIAGQLSGMASFMPAIQIPASWDVAMVSSHDDLTMWCAVFGWLEDA